jgi:hypothetical protein
MATRGNSNQIIIGAAQLFVADYALEWNGSAIKFNEATASAVGIPDFVSGQLYADTLSASANSTYWTNIGYTMNGLEVQFQPDFGEVQVDQLLDVAKLYKQGMQVNMVTAFAEATLDNLVLAIATKADNLSGSVSSATTGKTLNVTAGDLGEVPLERAIIAVGPGSGDPSATGANQVERVYVAHRALSIESVTMSAKRNEPSMYEVSFRLLPAANGSYGKIVDRVKGS